MYILTVSLLLALYTGEVRLDQEMTMQFQTESQCRAYTTMVRDSYRALYGDRIKAERYDCVRKVRI